MITLRVTLLSMLVTATLIRADAPPELTTLKQSFEKAKQQAISPLEKKYSDALTALKVRFTKDGNLEAALAVDTEIKALASPVVGASSSPEPPRTDSTQTKPAKTQQIVRGDFVYTLVHSEVSWKEAADACRQMGGELAAFESWTEWERIYKLFTAPAENNAVWIGGWRTEGTTGPWLWSDSSAVSMSLVEKIGYADKLERTALRGDIKSGGITADRQHFRRGYLCRTPKRN